ncbi:MAG TPA: FkbM family methyltransferase [Bryobacteraceae bacterium]|nr:FkbM family methyltransferase [Bryobacteraceae bacterium]
MLKRISSFLPRSIQQELRRLKIHLDIRRGRFRPVDPPDAVYDQIASFVNPGDWVVDVGANVGYYTWRLAHLVGKDGRVLAIEPIPETVEILTSVLRTLPYDNVTILNLAASDYTGAIRFSVPKNTSNRLPDYFLAHASQEGERSIYACALDQIMPPNRISLVKIDTEGHEYNVLQGMRRWIERDRPIIILEGSEDCEAIRFLVTEMRYRSGGKVEKSANIIAWPNPGG